MKETVDSAPLTTSEDQPEAPHVHDRSGLFHDQSDKSDDGWGDPSRVGANSSDVSRDDTDEAIKEEEDVKVKIEKD
jgi:hypothetical protein